MFQSDITLDNSVRCHKEEALQVVVQNKEEMTDIQQRKMEQLLNRIGDFPTS